MSNPVKRDLVRRPEDWRWSSFRHYAFQEVSVVEIESEWTARGRELAAHGGPARVFLEGRESAAGVPFRWTGGPAQTITLQHAWGAHPHRLLLAIGWG